MKYFVIKPAVGGEMGNHAQVDFFSHSPIIYKAHAELFYAPESDIIFASPFFLVRVWGRSFGIDIDRLF